MQWVAGFVTFLVIAALARWGVDAALDAWWSSEGLDPATRPPLNAGGEWPVSGAIGLGAGWLVTRALGED